MLWISWCGIWEVKSFIEGVVEIPGGLLTSQRAVYAAAPGYPLSFPGETKPLHPCLLAQMRSVYEKFNFRTVLSVQECSKGGTEGFPGACMPGLQRFFVLAVMGFVFKVLLSLEPSPQIFLLFNFFFT
jgi:hypothetical protein